MVEIKIKCLMFKRVYKLFFFSFSELERFEAASASSKPEPNKRKAAAPSSDGTVGPEEDPPLSPVPDSTSSMDEYGKNLS